MTESAPPPSGAAAEHRDRAARLAEWLGSCLGQAIDPSQLTIDAPSEGGWSNETWIVAIGGPEEQRVVVRLQPQRASMFPTYDLGRQLDCLSMLQDHPAIPTPRVIAGDLDGRWLGQPAFIMDHVAGRIPRDDKPTFVEAGWLFEATTAQQRTFHTSLLDALGAIHELPPGVLGKELQSGTANSNQLAVADLAELWTFDRGSHWAPVIEDGLEKLRADIPEPTSDGLLWGDARPANVITDASTFTPAALVDWELATAGTPERDLTWLMEMNWMRAQGAGLSPLPGFLTDDETVAYYAEQAGRELRRLDWYRGFAAVRVAVLMHRYLRGQIHAGRLDPAHRVLGANVATRRLETLLF